ncbi:hypothetical protein FBEOM_3872 [Fusarium beomiforme]|uniref:Uncharacterized protein n=1 Tax=Fusarium beomiforme TaxID=44412 RepID=A0A9P5DYR4_9HYPO|nr:hypothetical protein FBEOM_3872 [Fusarium beomiforme]
MAATYKIYFTNSSQVDNNFAFFSAVPLVTNNGGSPVYSNIIASQFVPADNGDTTFEIDVTKTYYAWTSISPVDVKTLPGQNIVTKISNSKLATLGTTGSPGSTFKLINSGGNPTFDPKATTFKAPAGAFQISSDANAFQPDQNFICGLGSVDGNGQRIPVATFAAQGNTIATITPVVKFYIAQFSSQKGTVINVSVLSKQAAEIDFTGRNINAAFVSQNAGGGFDVTYGTAPAMLELSKASSPKNLNEAQFRNINKLLEILEHKFGTTPGVQYQCKFKWFGESTEEAKAQAVARAANGMTNRGHTVNAVPEDPFVPASFGVKSDKTMDTVKNDWIAVVAGLGAIAGDPATVNANYVEAKDQSNDAYGQKTMNGGNHANGGYDTNNQSHNGNGYENNQLAQLLKGMKGLEVAAN